MAIITQASNIQVGDVILSGEGTLQLTAQTLTDHTDPTSIVEGSSRSYKVDLGLLPPGGITIPAATTDQPTLWSGELLGSSYAVTGTAITTGRHEGDYTATLIIEEGIEIPNAVIAGGTGHIQGGLGKAYIWHESEANVLDADEPLLSIKRTTLELANLGRKGDETKINIQSNGLEVGQGALVFAFDSVHTNHEFRGAGEPFNAAGDVIESGFGLATVTRGTYTKVTRLEELNYPITLAAGDSYEGIGNSLLSGTPA